MAYDWTKPDDKICNTMEIENFLKTYKTLKTVNNINNFNNDYIILPNEQSEVLEICKNQINNLTKSSEYNSNDEHCWKRIKVQSGSRWINSNHTNRCSIY